MKACIQRVQSASVTLPQEENRLVGEIGVGLLVLLGVGTSDSESEAVLLARKCAELRIFEDENGKMNRSISDAGGSMLVVSQFTLYADCRRGRRPSFTDAAPPELADRLYQRFVEEIRQRGIPVIPYRGTNCPFSHREETADGRRQTADGSRGAPAPLASAANCRLLSAVTFPFSEMSKQAFSPRVQYTTGAFRAEMHVNLVNDGPVTIWLDTQELTERRI